MKIYEEALKDYLLFHSNPKAFGDKVNNVSSLLGLNGYAKLISNVLPTYWVGDEADKMPKVFILGMNPAYHKELNDEMDESRNNSWEDYLALNRGWFHYYKDYISGHPNEKSPYFNTLWHLLSGLDSNGHSPYDSKYDYFQMKVINMDLIPYYSAAFNARYSYANKDYLSDRMKKLFESIDESRPLVALFNGGLYFELLAESGFVNMDCYEQVAKIRLYCFKYQDTCCILFSPMITWRFAGLTVYQLEYEIPKIIMGYCGGISPASNTKKKTLLIKQSKSVE